MNTDSNWIGISAGDLGDALQANWMPLSMIGIGLAWLAASNSSLIERVAKNERARAADTKIGQVAGEPVIFGQKEADRGGGLVGPNGELTALMKQMGSVPKEQRPALGKLINLKKKVGAVKGKLKLCCIHPDLLEVFRITRLDQVFEIHSEEQAALDKF